MKVPHFNRDHTITEAGAGAGEDRQTIITIAFYLSVFIAVSPCEAGGVCRGSSGSLPAI